MTLNVSGVTLMDHYVDGVQTTFGGSASQTVNVTGSSCLRNLRCVDLGGDGTSTLRFDISGNTAVDQQWQPFAVGTATGAATTASVSGFVRDNVIGDGTVDSGSVEMNGIFVDQRGNPRGVVSVAQNTVDHTDVEGIRIRSLLDAGGPGRLDVTLRDNHVGIPDDNSAVPYAFLFGAVVEARNTTDLCLDISGNDAGSVGGAAQFRVRQLDLAPFRLERFVGTGSDATAVGAFVAGQNDAGSTGAATVATTFAGVANGACLKP
jgi:hypothetical protein